MSALHSAAIGTSLLFFFKTAASIMAFLLCFIAGKRLQICRNLYLIFILGGLGVCGVGYLFWITASRAFPFLASTFYQSDVFAGYLLLLIPLSASLAVFSSDRIRGFLYLATTFFFVSSLLFTYSRGGIIVFAVAAVLWGTAIYSRKPAVVKRGAALVAFIFVFSVLYASVANKGMLLRALHNKIANSASWFVNINSRLSFWNGALKIFARHPILGSGPDTFGQFFPMFQEKFFWYSRFPHNFYLQVLSDQGIFSFVLTVGLIGFILIMGYRGLALSSPPSWNEESSPLHLGLFFGFLAGAMHLLLDVDSNFLTWSVLFWGEGGLLLALSPLFSQSKGMSDLFRVSAKTVLGIVLFLLIIFQSTASLAMVFDEQAEALQSAGMLERAREKERLAISFFPLESHYYERLAMKELSLYESAGEKSRLSDAVANLKRALEIDPVKPLYMGELAGMMPETRQGERVAADLLKESLILDPLNYPQHRIRLADLEVRMGKIQDAKKDYEQVIDLYPEGEMSRVAFFRLEDFQNAVALAHIGLAVIDLKQDDSKKALLEIETAKRFSAGNPKVNYYSGLMALSRQEWEKSEKNFQVAVYDPSLGSSPWKWLSYSEMRLKNYDKAKRDIRQAFRFPVNDVDLFAIAGDIYSIQGEREEAVRIWKEGLKFDPKNKYLSRRIQGSRFPLRNHVHR